MPNPATKLLVDIQEQERYLAPIRESYAQRERYVRHLYDKLRKVCPHERLIARRVSWGSKRMCVACGVIEDETTHGAGFHVLTARADNVYIRSDVNRDEWERLSPPYTLLIDWCYGNKDHPAHWVEAGRLVSSGGTRCAEAEQVAAHG